MYILCEQLLKSIVYPLAVKAHNVLDLALYSLEQVDVVISVSWAYSLSVVCVCVCVCVCARARACVCVLEIKVAQRNGVTVMLCHFLGVLLYLYISRSGTQFNSPTVLQVVVSTKPTKCLLTLVEFQHNVHTWVATMVSTNNTVCQRWRNFNTISQSVWQQSRKCS